MKIGVIGTGYVGLVSGTCLAETGNHVICMDKDIHKIENLKQGKVPIYEPGLENLVLRNIKDRRLIFSTDLKEIVEQSAIIFLALPTPPNEDGSADLSYILNVAEQLGTLIKEYKIIINKSTVPVGTAEKTRNKIAQNCKCEFDVVSNPEFLREGFAVEDFLKPDRIIIGTQSKRAQEQLKQLYKPYVRQGNPIIFMDEKTSELTKYAANSFLAMKISFMNEIALLCDKVGANVDMIRRGIGTDDRIGKRFLFPGIGYGGSCFPKDVEALTKTAVEYDYDFKILKSVIDVNKKQIEYFINKITTHFKGDIKGKKFALWGLAFKPNTDDIREAPALTIINSLTQYGAIIKTFDPEAMNNVKKLYPNTTNIHFENNMYDCLEGADSIIIATEWNEFRNPDWEEIKSKLKHKIIFDGRNIFEKDDLIKNGFIYYSIGR